VAGGKTPLATFTCIVCGAEFTAKRKSAKSCSGKCRLTLFRRTRVADVAARLAKAEAALHEASVALDELRALVEVGAGKVAP
jgi:hypothetical protein